MEKWCHGIQKNLVGGFKYFLCSTLPGNMIQFDEHMFQMGWFNHQLETLKKRHPASPRGDENILPSYTLDFGFRGGDVDLETDSIPRYIYGWFPKIGVKPPKLMVKIMENPMYKWMIWGENPLFSECHPYKAPSFTRIWEIFFCWNFFKIGIEQANPWKSRNKERSLGWSKWRIPDPTNGQSLVFGLPGKW